MTRSALIIVGVIGLAFAAVETILLPVTLTATVNTSGISLAAAILGLLSAALCARVLLGRRGVHRYYRAGVPVLSAISGLAFESAFSNWLISQDVYFGAPPTTLRTAVIIALVIGAVAYLLAATMYGFVGTRQGVTLRGRVGLLLLLLLCVLPGLNILGSAGFIVTAFVRKPATPATAPASA
jgi:hypothetical protein